MSLGKIIERANGQGEVELIGTIVTNQLNNKIRLFENEKISDDSPDYVVMMKSNNHGEYFDAGVAWEQHHKNVGRYFSLDIFVDGETRENMRLVAWPDRHTQGVYMMSRSTPRAQQQQQQAA